MKVYSLSEFSEEIKAVAAAKCSRSPNTFLEDAQAVTEEKAADFHEKVVVAYGHGSVADMSIGSLVFEDVSTLMAETFFDIQTGKFQAKSSRYVKFSRDRVVKSFGLSGATEARYWAGINILFDAYEALLPLVQAWVEAQPNMVGKSKAVVNARVFDALRYLLPLGAQTNFATRLSGRDTSELVRVLLASPLKEASDLAREVKAHSLAETPTLVRHAEYNRNYDLLRNIGAGMKTHIPIPARARENPVELVRVFGDQAEVLKHLKLELGLAFSADDHTLMLRFNEYMAGRENRHQPVPHALRAARVEFETFADFGAWKDLRRHRRNELFRPQLFTFAYGYNTSEDICAIGGDVEHMYNKAIRMAYNAWVDVHHEDRWTAQYLIPHAAIQRWRTDMDLEQLIYTVELRTEPYGHISYRRIARDYYDQAVHFFPDLLTHVRVHPVEGVEAHH